jgi:hypothetical protein
MALIFQGADEHGVIWIVDRKDDKTFVMLACSAQTPLAAGPPPDAETSDDIYPLFNETPNATVVDVSDVPPGLQRFESDVFLARAAEAAGRHEQVFLDRNAVAEWGYLPGPGTAVPG